MCSWACIVPALFDQCILANSTTSIIIHVLFYYCSMAPLPTVMTVLQQGADLNLIYNLLSKDGTLDGLTTAGPGVESQLIGIACYHSRNSSEIGSMTPSGTQTPLQDTRGRLADLETRDACLQSFLHAKVGRRAESMRKHPANGVKRLQ